MKDNFKHLEVEMTLEAKFSLVCSAIGTNVSNVVSNDTSKRASTNRIFVADFLSEYINYGLPEIMQKSTVTVYEMICRAGARRINGDQSILRLDKMLSNHIDKWIKSSKYKSKK